MKLIVIIIFLFSSHLFAHQPKLINYSPSIDNPHQVIDPEISKVPNLEVACDFDPYEEKDFQNIIKHYLPLTYALNSLNRSMGHQDAYPFVLSPPVIKKLTFIHKVVQF